MAINKPNGLAVHKSKLVGNTNEFALQLLRDQILQRVYPAHRLDRKTSGVMLFTLAEKVSSMLQKQFMERNVSKITWQLYEDTPKHMRLLINL